jgi:2-polyprenyl-6-methoxyphenol hydroxylase-like FAD-dependent oxidoreductase
VRRWAGFTVNRDPECLTVASLLFQGGNLPDNALLWVPQFSQGKAALLFRQRESRFRVYLMFRSRERALPRLSGHARTNDFINACISCGVAREWLDKSAPSGPLAEFEGADVWVKHPYLDGVVLIGDAAAASDPSWGSGLSLTLKDVRTLRDQLLAYEDWEVAAQAYAVEHDRYYEILHRIEAWYTQLFYDIGRDADERRERAFSRDRQNIPDILGLGPDSPCDEQARRDFFGEE